MAHFALFLWLSFLVTFTPGPSALFAISQSIRVGFLGAIPGLLGNLSASVFYGLLTACGMGYFLRDHPILLESISIIGAIYLIFTGLNFIFGNFSHKLAILPTTNNHYPRNTAYKDFLDGFVVNLSNPKIMLFYLIVIPQFVTNKEAMILSLIILALIQNTMKAASLIFYSILAHRLRTCLSTVNTNVIQKISGSVIFVAGLLLLLDNIPHKDIT